MNSDNRDSMDPSDLVRQPVLCCDGATLGANTHHRGLGGTINYYSRERVRTRQAVENIGR
jgi:hypothetical protein